MSKKTDVSSIIINIFFILLSSSFILPFLLIVSISFTGESEIEKFGYMLIPQKISFDAYKYIFANPKQLIDSYTTTIVFSIIGTVLSVLIMSLMAYPLSRKDYKARKFISFIIFFTMLFGGGLVPSYILITQYLHINNTIWVYIFPSLVSAWNIIIIKTFFMGAPYSLIEASKIDGASEFRIFFQILLPISKPVLATMGVLGLLSRWNDWYTAMIYIDDANLYSLQYMLQRILKDYQFLVQNVQNIPNGIALEQKLPNESMKFAMCVVAAGPMIAVFPFFQKYFVKGLTVGSVKE